MIDPKVLAEIRESLEAATQGPWLQSGKSEWDQCIVEFGLTKVGAIYKNSPPSSTGHATFRGDNALLNSIFVAHAPDNIRTLLSAVDALMAENAALYERAATMAEIIEEARALLEMDHEDYPYFIDIVDRWAVKADAIANLKEPRHD